MESTENLFSALARAQATYGIAQKNGYNPHYKSSFSTFEDLVLASRESLTREGIAVTQYVETECEDRDYLVTVLMHVSGQTIKSKAKIVVKDRTDVQKFGSALTYLKRYIYAAMCGIATSEHDDDGNDAIQEVLISTNQHGLLKALLKGDADLEQKIIKHYGIAALKNLPARYMNNLVDRLKAKEEQEDKADQTDSTEKITKEQLEEILHELNDYPLMTESLKKALNIQHLADMPKNQYIMQMQNVRRQKLALKDSPQKEW